MQLTLNFEGVCFPVEHPSDRTYLLTKSEPPTSGAVVPVATVVETALLPKLS